MSQVANYLRAIGCPGDYVEAVAKTQHQDTPAMQIAAGALEDRGSKAIVLSGGAGAGKTFAACWWLSQVGRYVVTPEGQPAWSPRPEDWLWLRDRALFAKAYDFGRMNLRYDRDDRARLERLKAVRFLALDDLGAEVATPESAALVEELVDHRCANRAWTFITTNVPCGPKLDESAFAKRYGARVVDRIFARGQFRNAHAMNLRREVSR